MITEKAFYPKLAPNFQIILDATDDIIWAFDREYNLAYCNNSFTKKFELFLNEPLDKNLNLDNYLGIKRFAEFEYKWENWIYKAFDGEKFKDNIEFQISNKKLFYSLNFTPVMRNNEVAYIQISAREETQRQNYELLLKDKNNKEENLNFKSKEECIICEAKKEIAKQEIVHERDEAVELLKENIKRLNIVFDGSNDGFWDWDIVKDQIYHSKTFYHILGYENDEENFKFLSWKNLIHKKDVDRVMKILETHMQGETEQYHCEYRVLTKEGEYKWILDRGKVAERDGNNTPIRFAGTISDISIRKKVEKSLQLTQHTVDKSAVSIFWYDKNAKYFYVNDFACEKLGYTKEEFLKFGVSKISHGWNIENWKKLRLDKFKNNRVVKLESVYCKKNGEEFPVEIISTQILYEGEIIFVVFATDITDRKIAEAKIKESESRFASMSEDLPVMIFVADKKLQPTYINKMANNFIGKDSNKTKIIEFVHPDDLEFFKLQLKLVFKNKVKVDCEVRFQNNVGGFRWILTSIVPRMLEDGKFIGFLAIGIDITERKLVETKLLESETQFNEITSVVGEGIYLIDSDWNLKFANPEFSNLLGFNINDVLNKNIRDVIFTHDTENEEVCYIEKIFENGESIRVAEDYYKNVKGDFIPVSFVASPIKRNEKIVGCVVAFHDISERIAADEEICRYVEELHFNKQLTEDNANEFARLNEMLAESESRLTKLNASKDKFFSIISHDLRSPFTSIIGFAEVMLEDIDILTKEEIKDFTGSIYKSSKNVQNLLENLLQWSRVQTGCIELNKNKFSLNNLVNDVVALFQVNAVRKKIILTNNIETEYTVFADRFMLDTVIRNLVSNAIKFTKQNGKINICCEEQKDKGSLQIIVSDSGVGMKEDIVNKLFKIDSHITTKGTDKEKGTGLGLILCKEFIEQHGGKIWAESTEGEGSKFNITLPQKFE